MSSNISTERRSPEFGRRLAKAFGTSKPAEIARKLGITYQGAKNYLEGRIPGTETLIVISNSTGRSIDWLLGREDEEIGSAKVGLPRAEKPMLPVTLEYYDGGWALLPLVGEIAAGEPIEPVPADEPEQIPVPDFLVKPGRKHIVLRVRGNSMAEDGIPDGALVICEVRDVASNGERVVALVDGNATLKYFYLEPGGARLQPANKSLGPIHVGPDRQLQIQGIVVGIFRKP